MVFVYHGKNLQEIPYLICFCNAAAVWNSFIKSHRIIIKNHLISEMVPYWNTASFDCIQNLSKIISLFLFFAAWGLCFLSASPAPAGGGWRWRPEQSFGRSALSKHSSPCCICTRRTASLLPWGGHWMYEQSIYLLAFFLHPLITLFVWYCAISN